MRGPKGWGWGEKVFLVMWGGAGTKTPSFRPTPLPSLAAIRGMRLEWRRFDDLSCGGWLEREREREFLEKKNCEKGIRKKGESVLTK